MARRSAGHPGDNTKVYKSMSGYELLPQELLDRASLRGNEYAWRIAEIPNVISAARAANLLNVGGQLQFRLPDGATCECYWVEVDTFKTVPSDLNWESRVARSAATALANFENLQAKYDFIAEGKRDFGEHLVGINPEDAMWFVWYLEQRQ
jgi:hypothetical protein